MQSVLSDIDIYSSMSMAVELLILHDTSDYGSSTFLKPATIMSISRLFKIYPVHFAL